jgi:hypothetical protein
MSGECSGVIIRNVERTVRTGERQSYESSVARLWERLGIALTRLERIAEASPEQIVDEAGGDLPSLQYALHASAELAVGIQAPKAAEAAHEELLGALGHARDTTAEVSAAVDDEDELSVERMLPEWRGSLFRVRLARLRALERSPLPLPEEEPDRRAPHRPAPDPSRAAVTATVLIFSGAALFTAGAVLAAWPLWAAGLALFGGGFILFRP